MIVVVWKLKSKVDYRRKMIFNITFKEKESFFFNYFIVWFDHCTIAKFVTLIKQKMYFLVAWLLKNYTKFEACYFHYSDLYVIYSVISWPIYIKKTFILRIYFPLCGNLLVCFSCFKYSGKSGLACFHLILMTREYNLSKLVEGEEKHCMQSEDIGTINAQLTGHRRNLQPFLL